MTNTFDSAQRLAKLGVTPGTGVMKMSLKQLRKAGGFADRAQAYRDLLHIGTNEEATRYRARLTNCSQRCEGCELLLESHIHASAGDFFFDANSNGASFVPHLFQMHGIDNDEVQSSIKRILLVLEAEYDFDNSYNLMDLVCLLSLQLNTEAEVYAAVRKLVVLNSSRKFLPTRKRRLGSDAPRRLLCATSTFSSLQLASLVVDLVKQRNAKLAAKLIVLEIQYWLDRWLVPILPYRIVVSMLDCIIAGDDLKLMMRICLSAIFACQQELLQDNNGTTTAVICNAMQANKQINFNFAIPTRKRLTKMEIKLPLAIGSRFPKRPCVHVPRHLVTESQIVDTFALASTFAELVPDSHRFGLLNMTQIPLRDLSLKTLFAQCSKDDQSTTTAAYVLLVFAKASMRPDELVSDADDGNKDSSKLTSVVFGVLSNQPFYIGATGGGVNGGGVTLFQVQPSARTWPCFEPDLQHCLHNSFMFGRGALSFVDTLAQGSTERCALFQNDPLCYSSSAEDEAAAGTYYFKTIEAEVWVLPKS